MAIEVKCDCGLLTAVRDEHAGRRVKCPGCGRAVLVPFPPAPGDSPAGKGAPVPRAADVYEPDPGARPVRWRGKVATALFIALAVVTAWHVFALVVMPENVSRDPTDQLLVRGFLGVSFVVGLAGLAVASAVSDASSG